VAELSDVILVGTVAAQPAATTVAVGTLYCQTDGTPNNRLQRSNGTTWDDYAPTSGGGGGIALSAGTQSASTSTVVFSNSNGVTFGMSGSTRITATVKTDYAGTGITTATTTGTVLVGTNSSNGLSLGVPAWITAGGGGGSINVSAGTTSNNLTNIKFADSNGVSFGLNGSTVTATVQTNYLTTARASTDAIGLNTAKTNVTWTVNSSGLSLDAGGYAGTGFTSTTTAGTAIVGTHNTAGLSLGVPNYLTTADLSANSSKYVQNWKLTGNVAGTTSSAQGTDLWFSGGNSITVSGSSNSIVFSVGAYLTTAMQSNAATISNINVSGGTTSSNLSNFKLIDSNGVSWSLDTGSKIYATVKTDYLTTAMASNRGSDFVAATALAAGTNASVTVSSSGISVSVPFVSFGVTNTGNTAGNTGVSSFQNWVWAGTNNITISQSTMAFGGTNTIWISGATVAGQPVNFSAGTTSNNLGSVVFSNSGGISFGLNGSTITASASTVGTATTGAAVGSANSVGTITRWVAEDHVHAGIGAIGISTSGNTAGTTGSVQGTYWFQGGSNQTVSQITSNNGSHTLVIVGKNEGYVGMLEPYPLLTATQTFAPGAGTWYLAPFTAFGSMSGGRINVLAQNTGTANLFLDIGETAYNSGSTGGIQQSYTWQANVALFSQGTGANSSLLQSLWSNSHSFGWSKSQSISTNAATNIAVSLAQSVSYISDIGSDGAYTNVQLAGAGSSTIANSSGNSTLLSTVFSSGRNLLSGSLVQPFGFNTTISAGVYWLGYAWSSTRARASTGNLTTGSDFSFNGLVGMSRLAVDSVYRNFGSTTSSARSQLIPYGLYTAAANMTPPVDIKLSSDLSSLASQWVPYFNFQVRGLTK
jgi:hypothetical protein